MIVYCYLKSKQNKYFYLEIIKLPTMSVVNLIITRGISTTCSRLGKRNFRKFELINKRGTKIFKKQQMENPSPDYPIDKRGVRDTGLKQDGKFIELTEMIPELIVPNLEGFKLKAYVSYRSTDVFQSEFTAKDLFDAVYAQKIVNDFKKKQLKPDGESMNPSPEEKLTSNKARQEASKPGNDIFTAPPKPLGHLFPVTPR
ncbi:large ribosomal subunit protein mL41 [Phymastichus coffea]|uniref:large ribosomal subunit protein mL41 n=1 Tax=Phymastichus coffea TaxID=108790 RepID=UPI00273CAA6A|nr:large ribosomal subunit protein mL41 [Phymastichus coffea]